jgi:3-oxoacyl-[acyl-carrier-protein] synthase-3
MLWSMRRAYIAGTGSYLPARVVTNEEICERAAGTSDEWIRAKLGIVTRRVAAPEEQTSDLALHAARRALEAAGLEADQLDGIILAVGTGDVITPATAGYLQAKLGITSKCFAFDIKVACAGTIAGLMMARGLIESGICQRVMVAGSHIITRTSLNWEDRGTAPIFGDGAGAVILAVSPDGERGILASKLGTDGTLTGIVGQYVGGTVEPITPRHIEEKKHYLSMDGRAVWNCAERELPQVIRDVLAMAGKTPADVDFVVSHQANKRLLEHILQLTGIPVTKTYTNVEKYGNTVAASALIALDEVTRAQLIAPGSLVVMSAIGAGMTWGAHLIRW